MTPAAFAALMALSDLVPMTQGELEEILRQRLTPVEYARWALFYVDQQTQHTREADEDPYQW